MARRRNGSGEGAVSLDSLLDTMANVVGILVLLLIVVQVSVGGALERIWADVEKPTAAQLEAAENDWHRLSDELERKRGEWQALGQRARGDDDAEKLARARARLDELELAIAAAKGELTRVAVELEDAGDQPFESERVVRLPDPRPPPQGATEINYFCRYGRMNAAHFQRIFGALRSGFAEVTGAQPWDREVPVEELPRIASYFDSRRVGDGIYRWGVRPDSSNMRLEFILRWADTKVGLSDKDLRDPHSRYAMRLQTLDPEEHYLLFYVWSDSYEVYLTARRIAEDAGFRVGWRAWPADLDPVAVPRAGRTYGID
ncbi:MAG: hypothetical protein ACQGVK_19130 [Myxococcota bacterium]